MRGFFVPKERAAALYAVYAATALSSVGSKLSKHFSSIFPYNAALNVVQYPLLLFNIIHGSPEHKLLTAQPSQTEMAMN